MARHINLLDPRDKTRSPYLTAIQMGLPMVIVLVATLVLGGIAKYRVSALNQQLVALDAQLQPIKTQLTQAQKGAGLEKVNAALSVRLAQAEAQLKARQDIQGALQRGELGSSQGFSEYMRAFARRAVPGVWLTGLTLDSGTKEVTLHGRAISADAVANLINLLREEPVLKGRTISALRLAPVIPEKTQAAASAPLDSSKAPPTSTAPQNPAQYEFILSSVASIITTPSSPATASQAEVRQ